MMAMPINDQKAMAPKAPILMTMYRTPSCGM